MNIVMVQAAVSPAANTLGGQGWRQAGELGVALLLSGAIGLEREIRQKDAVGSAAGAGLLVLAALTMGIYFVATLVLPIARRRLPLAATGTSTLRVRYPDGHGILRRVLNEATQRGFVIDDLAAETANDRSGESAAQGKDDWPAMVAVTMHVHGRRPVSELASALTELDLVDAVVAANHQATDE
jgi:putative Mg2+ transporter-C (MgtC) family protein